MISYRKPSISRPASRRSLAWSSTRHAPPVGVEVLDHGGEIAVADLNGVEIRLAFGVG